MPIWFDLFYGLLAWRFSYPGILRATARADVILSRFRAGGSGLILTWWFFALGAIAFIPIAVLSAQLIPDPTLATSAVVVGVSAALVQALGLLRWVFLVPHLARESASGADPKTVDLVFQSFHRYLGVAVGEHLGYLGTGAWTILLRAGAATRRLLARDHDPRLHHRCDAAARRARVRRSVREGRLEGGRHPRAGRLHPVVDLARRDRDRAADRGSARLSADQARVPGGRGDVGE